MNAPLASRLIPTLVVLLALTAAPARAASPPTPALDRGWTASTFASPPQGMGYNIMKVVAGGPGFLALGTENSTAMPSPSQQPSQHVELWASSDGLSWHSVHLSSDLFPDNTQVIDMVAGPHGIVITGTVLSANTSGPPPPPPLLFWSSTDGEHWTRSTYAAPDVAFLNVRSLAAGPAGFVALGLEFSKSRAAKPPNPSTVVLISTDGSAWQPAQTALPNVVPAGIVADGSGFVVVGMTIPPQNQPPPATGANQAVAYTSHDGLTWSGPHLLPLEQNTDQSNVYGLSVAHGMVVALGNENGPDQSEQKIWTSADGEQWQASTSQGDAGPHLSLITSLGDLLVATGFSPAGAVLLSSSDGLHWSQAADDRAFGSSPAHQISLQSIVGFQNGLLAIGFTFPAPSPRCGAPAGGAPQTAPPLVAWRWTPQSSQAAPPPPRPSHLDPRSFSLRVADLPAGVQTPYGQGYIPLCSLPNPSAQPGPNGPTLVPGPFSPLLGKYTAYQSMFAIQHGQGLPAENVRSITIVAGSKGAARTAILRAPKYFSPAYGYPGKPKELRTTNLIGKETRLFATHTLVDCGEDCLPTAVPADAVIWRQGRDIGIVVVYGALSDRQNQKDALRFAAAQAAHLRQTS